MGRPAGKTDYARRLKAWEMYASGVSKSHIAQELGVTRPCIGVWAKKDQWEDRLNGIVSRAEEAVNSAVGNEVADALVRLRSQMSKRIDELERLCTSISTSPGAKLTAIKYWLELAGIKRAMPNPADPTTPKSLELIEDLLHGNEQLSEGTAGERHDIGSGIDNQLSDTDQPISMPDMR